MKSITPQQAEEAAAEITQKQENPKGPDVIGELLGVERGESFEEWLLGQKRKQNIKNEFARITTTNEEIESNMKNVARINSVYDVDKSRLQRTGKRPSEIFADFFRKWGNRIDSKKFGEISLGNSSVKSEVRHGITAEKIASIEAIPEVIEKGEVIFSEPKNEGTSRIVVCAPIKIGETPYYIKTNTPEHKGKIKRFYKRTYFLVRLKTEIILFLSE